MSDTNDHVQLNPGWGGATIATDVVDGAHYQYVKIAHGSDSTEALPTNRRRPLPVTIEQLNNEFSNKYVAVAGSTDGTTPVSITGDVSVSVGTVDISGGTLNTIIDGVSADIRSVVSGAKIGVHTIASDTVAVTGVVDVDNQVDVNIANVDLPSTVCSQSFTDADGEVTLPTWDCSTGVRIKNIGPTGKVFIGSYELDPGENIFIEISNPNLLTVVASGTPDICMIAT